MKKSYIYPKEVLMLTFDCVFVFASIRLKYVQNVLQKWLNKRLQIGALDQIVFVVWRWCFDREYTLNCMTSISEDYWHIAGHESDEMRYGTDDDFFGKLLSECRNVAHDVGFDDRIVVYISIGQIGQ